MTPEEIKARAAQRLDAWIAALWGDLPQAKGNLRTDKGQCCLGVFLDTLGVPYVGGEKYGESFYYSDRGAKYPLSSDMASIGLQRGGFPLDRDPWLIPASFKPELEGKTLAAMNDNLSVTFREIALLLHFNRERLINAALES